MDLPTPAEVRALSEFLTSRYPDPGGDAALLKLIEAASSVVSDLTGRSIGATPGEEVPAYKLELARRVVAIKAEQVDFGFNLSAEERQAAFQTGTLRSITAGPWSESYFAPGETSSIKALDRDPFYADLLWALATQDMRDYWLALWSGKVLPADSVTRLGWSPREPRVTSRDFRGGG